MSTPLNSLLRYQGVYHGTDMLAALLLFAQQPPLQWPNIDKAVIYEANFRAMSPQGGFRGVTQRLDHIKSLGVNVLWLMPIHPVGKERSAGGLGSPYAIQNFTELNPELGTEAEFRHLVREAQKREIAVILDWVANHTSWDNPWLQNSDWFTKGPDGKPTIPAGTNWNDVADLNFNNYTMRREMVDSMSHWVKRFNIDGFRCDYADGVPADFWKMATTTLEKDAGRPLFFLAEGARQDHYASGFDLTFDWTSYGLLKDLFAGTKTPKEFVSSVGDKATMLRFVTNHDQYAWEDTPVNVFKGADAAFGAFVLAATTGGVPLIYSGQEIGWPTKIPFFERSALDWNTGKEYRERFERFMQFRAQHLTNEKFEDLSSDAVVAFRRGKLLVAVNVTNKAQTMAGLQSAAYLNGLTGGQIYTNGELVLTPHQTVVLLQR